MRRFLIIATGLALLATASAAGAADPCRQRLGERHTAVKAIDASTALLDDGTEVRLAGILAPEPPVAEAAGEPLTSWPFLEDAKAALTTLIAGKTIALPTGPRKLDRYGRLRSDLLIADGKTANSVAVALVGAGMARVFPLNDDRVCTSLLLEAETLARSQKLGLWRAEAYSVRSPAKPKELSRYQDQFVIVEGTVTEVSETGGRVFINFGPRWRQDFTAVVEKRNRKRFQQAGIELTALNGARVRVRGYLGYAYGPALGLEIPALLEIITPAPEKPAAEAALDPGR